MYFIINAYGNRRGNVFTAVKPGPQQQQCRSNIVECYNVERCFDIVAVFGDNVEATFDFVAKNGNNVERVLR